MDVDGEEEEHIKKTPRFMDKHLGRWSFATICN